MAISHDKISLACLHIKLHRTDTLNSIDTKKNIMVFKFPSNRIVWQSLADQGVEFREADLLSAETPEDALFALVDKHTQLFS
jgi:selenocysteine lyase/cysteine desulfurase